VSCWLVPSTGQNIPIQTSHYLPPQKILLVENRLLQASKGAEHTMEKIHAMLYGYEEFVSFHKIPKITKVFTSHLVSWSQGTCFHINST